jgi:hypothetical protein
LNIEKLVRELGARRVSYESNLAGTVRALGGCAIVTQIATQQDAKKAKECFADAKATPEGQLVHKRIWSFDGTDTADKLTDSKPLTPPERDALVQFKSHIEPCRQIIIQHAPYWHEFFQRQDQIFSKLASGELPVGLANKLAIESNGQFQTDVSKDHADAVQADEYDSSKPLRQCFRRRIHG